MFVDRRNYDAGVVLPTHERRQFTNSHDGLSPEARELALAIDGYKLVIAGGSSPTRRCSR